jgi:hypothetical protein
LNTATFYESGKEMQSWGITDFPVSLVSGLAQCVQQAASSEERLGQNQHQGRCRDGTLEHYGVQDDPLVCAGGSARWSQDPECINYRGLSIFHDPRPGLCGLRPWRHHLRWSESKF